jgi:hypothetical protein
MLKRIYEASVEVIGPRDAHPNAIELFDPFQSRSVSESGVVRHPSFEWPLWAVVSAIEAFEDRQARRWVRTHKRSYWE